MNCRARWIRAYLISFSVPLVLAGGGCTGIAVSGEPSNIQGSDNDSGIVKPLFPSDYETTFQEVAACHETASHGRSYTRTFANDTAAAKYLAGMGPLPEGSIIVKAEYSEPDCPETALTGWAAMEKRQPGFNSVAGDWHWQLVTDLAGVLHNDEATCIGCHMEPVCIDRDFTCGERPGPP